MKKLYLVLGAFLALALTQNTKADTIVSWTFETSQPSGSAVGWFTNITAEVGSGTASAYHAGSSIYTHPAGNGSASSLSSTNWAVGDFYQFVLSTMGYEDIQISFDQTGSNTGPKDYDLLYSLDGINFTTFASYSFTNASWSSSSYKATSTLSFDLSSVTELNDTSEVYFRVVDSSTTSINFGTVAAGGSDRIDNFTVTATLVPEPSSIALAALGGLACLVAVRRRK